MLRSDAHKSSGSQVISPKSQRGYKVGKEPGRARVSAASLTSYFPIWCSVKHFRELLLVKSQSWVPESRFKNSSKSFPLEGACHSHQCIKVPEKPCVNVFNSISLSYPKYILGTWNFFFQGMHGSILKAYCNRCWVAVFPLPWNWPLRSTAEDQGALRTPRSKKSCHYRAPFWSMPSHLVNPW